MVFFDGEVGTDLFFFSLGYFFYRRAWEVDGTDVFRIFVWGKSLCGFSFDWRCEPNPYITETLFFHGLCCLIHEYFCFFNFYKFHIENRLRLKCLTLIFFIQLSKNFEKLKILIFCLYVSSKVF